MIWVLLSNRMKWVCRTHLWPFLRVQMTITQWHFPIGNMLQWWRCKLFMTRIYTDLPWRMMGRYDIGLYIYIYIHTWNIIERLKIIKGFNLVWPFAGWRTLSAPLTWHVGSSAWVQSPRLILVLSGFSLPYPSPIPFPFVLGYELINGRIEG